MANERIFIVEDEGVVAQDIKQILEGFGYEVVGRASSGEDAILAAETAHADLVLMDIILKGSMDGIDAATEIRSRLSIPVIFLTAHASDDLLKRAKLAEPFGYVIKPFNSRELHCVIEMALFKHKADQKVKQALDESERLNRLMLDREFRIKQLRDEVSSLMEDKDRE